MPARLKFLPFFLSISLLLGACSSNTLSQPNPTRTLQILPSSTPTIPALPTYIAPTAPILEIKPASIPQVLFPDWDGVIIKSICLIESDELHGNLKEKPEDLKLLEAVSNTLQHMGISVIETGLNCDTLLSLDLNATSIGAGYGTGNHCYTGASVAVSLTLSNPSYPEKILTYENEIQPPSIIVGKCNDDPQLAPFESLWREGLLSSLAEIWGEPVYWAALSVNPYTDLFFAATEKLPSLSPGEDGTNRILSTLASAPNGELDFGTAIQLIRLWKVEQAVPYLRSNLYDSNLPWYFRNKASEGLYTLGSLSDSDFSVLMELFDTYPIGMAIGNVPRVVPATDEPDLFSLISIIAETQPADRLAIFMPAWLDRDESLQLQSGAAWILANIGESGYPVLIPYLGTTSGSLLEFIESQLDSQNHDLVPYLLQYLSTSDSSSGKANAFQILASITGKDFGKDLEKWQSWWETQK